jgi:ABC-type branched-subunit amino acid transport system permease subunit
MSAQTSRDTDREDAPGVPAATREGHLLMPVAIAGTVLACGLPWIADSYQLYVLSIAAINIMVATSLNLIIGYAGQFAKAAVAFMGLGSYATALLMVRAGWSFWLAWPTGALFAAAIGTVVALPALRLRGMYLAIISISFVLIVNWAFVHMHQLTQGAGASGFPVGFTPQVPGLTKGQAIFYLDLAAMLATLWLLRNLIASSYGRALLCMSEQPHAAPSLGINLFRLKVSVFALAGAVAGLAGGLHAVTLGYVDPMNYYLPQLVVQLSMVAVGGISSLLGSVLGALLITLGLEALREFKGLWEVAVGVLLLATIVFFPRGIAGFVERRMPGLRERRHGS